jgi:hypothetical protein
VNPALEGLNAPPRKSRARALWLAFGSTAYQTALEVVRARVLYALLVFIGLLAWGSLFLGTFTIESQAVIALDLSMTGTAIFCSLVSILLSLEFTGVVVKPDVFPALATGTGRGILLLGRWAGVALVSTAVSLAAPYLLMSLFWIAGASIADPYALWNLTLLLPLETLMLTAMTAAWVTLFPRAPALSMAIGYWVLSYIHHHPLSYGRVFPGAFGKVLYVLGFLIPDIELYNPRFHERFALDLATGALVQTGLFCAAFLLASYIFYRDKDL